MKSVVNYQETSRVRFHRGWWSERELSRETPESTPSPRQNGAERFIRKRNRRHLTGSLKSRTYLPSNTSSLIYVCKYLVSEHITGRHIARPRSRVNARLTPNESFGPPDPSTRLLDRSASTHAGITRNVHYLPTTYGRIPIWNLRAGSPRPLYVQSERARVEFDC